MRRLCFVLLFGCTSSASSWSAEVGPEGGQIVGKGVELWVPAGALDSPTEITITRIDDDAPPGWRALSEVYRFEPEGLTFSRPAEVRFGTRESNADERVLWQGDALEVLAAMRAGSVVSAEVTHFSTGMAGGPDDDGGTDAGADASTDALTDVGSDAAIAMANLDCWNDELLPSDHISSRLVTRGTEVLYTDHELLWRRDEAGTWTSTNLPEEIGFGPTEPEWRDSVMTVDDAGHIHVVLADNSDLGPYVPNYPYHLRESDTGWLVDRVPYEQVDAGGLLTRGPCQVLTGSEGGLPNINLTDLVAMDAEVHVSFECRFAGGIYAVFHCVRDDAWETCTGLPATPSDGDHRDSQLAATRDGLFLYIQGGDDPSDGADTYWTVAAYDRTTGWEVRTMVDRVDVPVDGTFGPGATLSPSQPILYYGVNEEDLEDYAMPIVAWEFAIRRARYTASGFDRETLWMERAEADADALGGVMFAWEENAAARPSVIANVEHASQEYVLVRDRGAESSHSITVYQEGEGVLARVDVPITGNSLRRMTADDAGSIHVAYAPDTDGPPPAPVWHHAWTCAD